MCVTTLDIIAMSGQRSDFVCWNDVGMADRLTLPRHRLDVTTLSDESFLNCAIYLSTLELVVGGKNQRINTLVGSKHPTKSALR